MAFFNETIAAVAAARTVRAALLVFFDFEGDPKRVWAGPGIITAGGYTWDGLGEFGTIDGLEQAIGVVAPQTTFTLSGVSPDIVALARNQSDLVKGRDVTVYIQFFDENWQPLDEMYAVWSGILDQMKYSAIGPIQRTVTVTAEGLWTNRRRPVWGLYTDRDQNQRFPGDRGLEQVSDLVNKTIHWPEF
jgi:hypothetical protein